MVTPKNMSKRKEQNKSIKKSISPAFNERVSLVIPCYNEHKRIDNLLKTLKAFDNKWNGSLEIIIVDDGSTDGSADKIEKTFASAFSSQVDFELHQMPENGGKGAALQAGVEKASGDYILTIDADMATSPMELLNWLKQLPNRTFQKDEILIGSREHDKSKVAGNGLRRFAGLIFNFIIQFFTNLQISDTQCGFKLYPSAIAKKLFSDLKSLGWAHDVELLYQARLMGHNIKTMPVKWTHQDDSKISLMTDSIKMFFATMLISLRLNFKHFIIQPIQDLSNKSWGSKDPSYYRLFFALLAVALFFLMPMLSFDYGITGDEEVQKIYGEKVMAYFDTDGKDKSALEYQNLYYYGGLFDYSAAKLHKMFPNWDVYELRHFLNAIVGFILILFTGFLGKELTGSWRVGFFALLFMTLYPRIFGHSMNNPKDIPFAASYAFTLLYLIRFIKQLPRPGSKTVIFLIIGIAASINVRVGGILLIAYTGLFIGLAYLLDKDLRSLLSNVKEVGRTALLALGVAVTGYFAGMLYWPFAREAPMSNPFEALREMSSFSTSIRMLFDGKHLWSDQLPWYYIPKWITISAPIFVLLGLLLFLGFFIKSFSIKKRLPILLLAFTAIFPISYAIYKDSLLYDGMRHFLFIIPVMVVLAAWGWGELISLKKEGNFRWIFSGLLILLLAIPGYWMVKNHPHQYTYFNELSGGMNNAYGKYETDYWMNSMKRMCEWLVENEPRVKSGEKFTVLTNCMLPVKHYMEKLAPNVRVGYTRFPDRYKYNGDYYLFIPRFVDKGFLEGGTWPPPNVVYEEKVDNTIIGAISKRIANHERDGYLAEKDGDFAKAVQGYEAQLKVDPTNDAALLGNVKNYLNLGNFPKMKENLDKLFQMSDSYPDAHFYQGIYYTRQNDNVNAKKFLEETVELNYKYSPAYYYLATIYANERNNAKALTALENYDKNGGNIPQAYDMAIQLSQAANDQARVLYFKAKQAYQKQDGQTAYNLVKQALLANKNYEPAIELNEAFEKMLKKQQK